MRRRKVSGERASTAATTARRASGVAAMKASSPPAAAAISASTGSCRLALAGEIDARRAAAGKRRPAAGRHGLGGQQDIEDSFVEGGRHQPISPGAISLARSSASFSARAPMVEPGLTAPTVGNRLPSTTMRSATA